MTTFVRFNSSFFLLIFAFHLISCTGQLKESFLVKASNIHQDSISLRAESLPEFRLNVHDQDYQGNQISGVIRTVFQDTNHNLWFGTQNGLCRYNKNGLIYFELKDYNNKEVTIYTILEDKNQNIWIGFGGGIAKYDGTYFTLYHEKNILTTNGLWSMAMDKKGLLWIGTTQGLFTFEGEKLTNFEIPEGKIDPSKGISTTKMIHSILEDSKGNLWFATNGGVYVYDGKTLKNFSEKEGLLSNFVNQIIESKDGNIWISTANGLFKFNGTTIENITKNLLLNNEEVSCIIEDKNGTIWFNANKREIYSYNGKEFTKRESKDKNIKPFPFKIYNDKQDRLWFVGFKGAYRYENNTFVNVTRNGPW